MRSNRLSYSPGQTGQASSRSRYTPGREGLQAIADRGRHRRSDRSARQVPREGWRAADEWWLARARGSRLSLMATAFVVGVGAVGARAARQLIDTNGFDVLLLA